MEILRATEHFRFMVKNLERAGVSAVIIEDKIGLKRNSFLELKRSKDKIPLKIFATKLLLEKMQL